MVNLQNIRLLANTTTTRAHCAAPLLLTTFSDSRPSPLTGPLIKSTLGMTTTTLVVVLDVALGGAAGPTNVLAVESVALRIEALGATSVVILATTSVLDEST